jgi:hypothetical protein
MFICVLHCLWDNEDPWAVVRRFHDEVGPGELDHRQPGHRRQALEPDHRTT